MLNQYLDNKHHLQHINKSNHLNYEVEYQIRELYHAAYNNTFHKILQVDLTLFLQLIFDQVKTTFELIYSKLIDSEASLIEMIQVNEANIKGIYQYQSQIFKKHIEEYNAMSPSFNFLKRFRKHCPQTSTFAFHLCNEKEMIDHSMLIEISVNNERITHVICINCKAIYSAQEIKLHCTHCKVNYFSSVLQEKEDLDLLPSTWLNYHCKRQRIEKMKCIKCFHILYYHLKSLKLICLNPRCNFTANPMSIIWKCSLCNVEFQSKAKIYNPYKGAKYQKAIRIALIIQQKAFPMVNCCENKDNKQLNYSHNKYCKGQLYLGVVNKKKAVVCDRCKVVFDYESYIWTCPQCNNYFTCSNNAIAILDNQPKKEIQDQYLKEKSNDNNINRKSSCNEFNDDNHDCIPYRPKTIQPLSLFELTHNKSKNNYNDNDNANDNKISLFKNSEDDYMFDLIGQNNSTTNRELISAIEEQIQEDDVYGGIFEDEDNDNEEYQYDYLKQIQVLMREKEKEDLENMTSILPKLNLDQYETIKKIGQGAFANIFEVENKKNKIHYAMKKVIANDIPELKKFQHEYEMIYTHPHSHIIQIYGFTYKKLDFTTYSVFILSELAECDWDSQINSYYQIHQSYSEENALIILKQLSSAFSFLQRNRITHRDIKPQNILVFPNNVYKISDFGEAKYVRKDVDMNTLKGTEMFMSPDMYKALYHNESKTIHNSYKSDMFSFGLCFVFALTLDYTLIDKLRKQIDCSDNINDINLSSYFANMLKKMITIKENERYDFISLEEYLKSSDK